MWNMCSFIFLTSKLIELFDINNWVMFFHVRMDYLILYSQESQISLSFDCVLIGNVGSLAPCRWTTPLSMNRRTLKCIVSFQQKHILSQVFVGDMKYFSFNFFNVFCFFLSWFCFWNIQLVIFSKRNCPR